MPWTVPQSTATSPAKLCPAGTYAARISSVDETSFDFKRAPENPSGTTLKIGVTVTDSNGDVHRLESLIGQHQEGLLAVVLAACGINATEGSDFDPLDLAGRPATVEVGSYTDKRGNERHCIRRWLRPSQKAAEPRRKSQPTGFNTGRRHKPDPVAADDTGDLPW